MSKITWSLKPFKLADLTDYYKNPRSLSEKEFKQLKKSLDTFGMIDKPIVNLDAANTIIGGHQRKHVLDASGVKECECWIPDRLLTEREVEELNIRLNKNTGSWDFDTLANEFELPDLIEWGFEPFELGVNDELALDDTEHQTLADRFIVPPFSVLDARQGYWQERKKAWIALGIESELGRGENLQGLSESNDLFRYSKDEYFARKGTLGAIAPNEGGDNGILASPGKYGNKSKGLARCYGQDLMKGENTNFSKRLTWVAGDREDGKLDEVSRKILAADRRSADKRSNLNGAPKRPDWAVGTGTENMAAGTSIFDPVLCELAYRWFAPTGGHVLDPFAGGSVRGIVASKLGYKYTGIDLSARQIEANNKQADELLTDNKPKWIVGDSKDINELAPGEYDFIFSCPPYADLEVYSDDPGDLSNMAYPDFKSVYHEIVYSAVMMLKPNRFACFVVGDVRDKKGFYRNFPAHTIEAFQDAGMTLYNEAVLVTAVGSLPIRVGKQFGSYRKLGKTHQNVLVFFKGDPATIKTWGAVECGDIEPELLGS